MSTWNGLVPTDMFAGRKDFGSSIHLADVGMLFLQYLDDAGEKLQECMEKADDDKLMEKIDDRALFKSFDRQSI